MARPKKDGRRATGIQGKYGYLYIVISNPVLKNGKKSYEKQWIGTGLTDIPANINKASEARERLLRLKSNIPIDINVSLAEYTQQFLEKKKREVSDTTYSSYYYRGRRIINYFGDIRLRDVNPSIIENFLDSLFIDHHLQPRSVKDNKILLGSILGQACKEGIIAYNPITDSSMNKNLAAKYAKDKSADDDFFSYEEAQIFLMKAKDHPLYEVFYLTLFYGLRREEVLGLRWQAINLKTKILCINHTVTKGTTINRLNSTKTASSAREYPLTDDQIEMFQRLKQKENANRRLCGNGYQENDYVFKHIDGSLYYPDYPSKAFRKLIKKNPDLPQGITFHGLRTSCVSILIHQNMDIKSIQKWVGHADINTTLKIYAKVKEKEAKQEVSAAMNGIIQLKEYSDS